MRGPSQDLSQWLRPNGAAMRMRSPLQLQGQPSFRPLRPSLRSRGALSGTGAHYESLAGLTTKFSTRREPLVKTGP